MQAFHEQHGPGRCQAKIWQAPQKAIKNKRILNAETAETYSIVKYTKRDCKAPIFYMLNQILHV